MVLFTIITLALSTKERGIIFGRWNKGSRETEIFPTLPPFVYSGSTSFVLDSRKSWKFDNKKLFSPQYNRDREIIMFIKVGWRHSGSTTFYQIPEYHENFITESFFPCVPFHKNAAFIRYDLIDLSNLLWLNQMWCPSSWMMSLNTSFHNSLYQ